MLPFTLTRVIFILFIIMLKLKEESEVTSRVLHSTSYGLGSTRPWSGISLGKILEWVASLVVSIKFHCYIKSKFHLWYFSGYEIFLFILVYKGKCLWHANTLADQCKFGMNVNICLILTHPPSLFEKFYFESYTYCVVT